MEAITELLGSIHDLLASLITILTGGGAVPGLPVDPSLPPIPELPSPAPTDPVRARKGTFLTLRV
ncbi:hypothetical protein ACFQY4_10380 [Catellatospora bangladeshensis]|uniref:hypothetical protein n=1 Tax=Catellatospora bangladeshensis TaxID=310355 RepID=UPI003613CA85